MSPLYSLAGSSPVPLRPRLEAFLLQSPSASDHHLLHCHTGTEVLPQDHITATVRRDTARRHRAEDRRLRRLEALVEDRRETSTATTIEITIATAADTTVIVGGVGQGAEATAGAAAAAGAAGVGGAGAVRAVEVRRGGMRDEIVRRRCRPVEVEGDHRRGEGAARATALIAATAGAGVDRGAGAGTALGGGGRWLFVLMDQHRDRKCVDWGVALSLADTLQDMALALWTKCLNTWQLPEKWFPKASSMLC